MTDAKIVALFKARDKAVETPNKKRFLSTHVGELPNSTYEGYVKIHKLRTEIIAVFSEMELPYHKVVFGRETYFPENEESYANFVIFYLIDTKEGWKIYRLAY